MDYHDTGARRLSLQGDVRALWNHDANVVRLQIAKTKLQNRAGVGDGLNAGADSAAMCAALIAAWNGIYEGFGNTRSRTLLANSGSLVAASVGVSPTLVNSRHRTAADSGREIPRARQPQGLRASCRPSGHRRGC